MLFLLYRGILWVKHLERHFKQFALGDLSVTDLTDQAKRRGVTVYLVERKQRDDNTNPIVRLSYAPKR